MHDAGLMLLLLVTAMCAVVAIAAARWSTVRRRRLPHRRRRRAAGLHEAVPGGLPREVRITFRAITAQLDDLDWTPS